MTDDELALHQRIVAAMAASGMDQKALALRSGISEATVSRLVSGKDFREPKVFTLRAIARVLGETVGTLLGEIEAVTPAPYRELVARLEALGADDRRRLADLLSVLAITVGGSIAIPQMGDLVSDETPSQNARPVKTDSAGAIGRRRIVGEGDDERRVRRHGDTPEKNPSTSPPVARKKRRS